MKIIKLSLLLLMLISLSTCDQNMDLKPVEFLIGIWKVEEKESYEAWEKKEGRLKGVSYKIENGQKVVSEKIEVSILENQIIYTPTVFDQNDRKGIPFKLISLEPKLFSFENSEHDFPKKIQYKILSKTELYISVLGENDKGFSYKLIKQTK